MAKLTDVRISHCPSKPGLFGHIHIGDDNDCAHPRYYKGSNGYLSQLPNHALTMNECGGHNHNGQKPFNALGQLFAAAPRMLALLDELATDSDRTVTAFTPANIEARALVTRLLALDIPAEDHTGYGPYFEKDGITPWQPKQ